ncbi:MAG: type II toxin-antitoxin system prevent-host-death family antitoxin [Treponema sp.]|nr:type II toxin-antitoxin system prevent-host-death family antitoxin [Treponema sp.]
MKISTKQLRMEPGRIISMVNDGLDITITYRGKSSAKLIPVTKKKSVNTEEGDTKNELFGLWKNRQETVNVGEYVRNIRRGRKF